MSKAKNTSEQLGSQSIGKLLIRQSAPAAVGFMVMSIYQLVDTFFVSRFVGMTAIGAITVVLPITFLISSIGMAIGVGGSSIISRSLGDGNNKKAQKTFGNMMGLTLSLVLILVLAGYLFDEQILKLFGANQYILPEAKTYFNILLPGIPFLGWAMMSNSAIRAEGKPKVAMFTLLIPAVINLVLDPIFIYYLDMGIAGAAWATTLGYICSGGYTAWFFLRGRSEIKINAEDLILSRAIVKEMSSIGSVTLVRQGSFSVLAIVLNYSLNKYGLLEYATTMGSEGGAHAIAIYGLVRNFTMFIIFPNIGIMQGLMPIVGYNYGAKNWKRLKESVRLSILWTTISSSVLYLLIFLFAKELIHFYTIDPELQATTPRALILVFLSSPLMGIGFVAAGYYQAIGKTKPAMFLTLARQGLFMVPLLLILPIVLGLDGIWYSIPLGEFLATVISAIWIWKDVLNRKFTD